jgi:hypothetical protein
MVALWHTSKKKAVASIRHCDQKAIGGEDPASDCRNWVRRPAQTQLAPGILIGAVACPAPRCSRTRARAGGPRPAHADGFASERRAHQTRRPKSRPPIMMMRGEVIEVR